MKTPKFKKKYSGLKLHGSEQRVSRATGRREWWLSFYCACGEMFSTTLSVANQSHAKQRPLRCQTCQETARMVREQKRQRRTESPRTHTFSGEYMPQMSAAAIRLLRDCKKSEHYKRIVEIVASFVRGSLKARIVPEWERIVVEAIELAKMEASGVRMPADWTRENICDGLCVVSYSHYTAPRDTGMM